jgi:hypothetical protein
MVVEEEDHLTIREQVELVELVEVEMVRRVLLQV